MSGCDIVNLNATKSFSEHQSSKIQHWYFFFLSCHICYRCIAIIEYSGKSIGWLCINWEFFGFDVGFAMVINTITFFEVRTNLFSCFFVFFMTSNWHLKFLVLKKYLNCFVPASKHIGKVKKLKCNIFYTKWQNEWLKLKLDFYVFRLDLDFEMVYSSIHRGNLHYRINTIIT